MPSAIFLKRKSVSLYQPNANNKGQFCYLRLFLGIENVSSRPLLRVEGGRGGTYIKNWKRWAILPRKKKLEKWPIFDQNHGLTPLEKSQFFDCLNVLFL